jgi:cell wall-associated NlpC family hydrolase
MRLHAFVCAILIAATAVVASAVPAGAQRASIGALRSRLERAGEHLDAVTEAYNEARLKRSKLDTKLNNARADAAKSEAKLKGVRKQLGVAVRDLYMHPAEGLQTFFASRSYGELERANALASHATLSTDGLILRIRKAKAEQDASLARLKGLRDQARRDELAIAEQRRAAVVAFQRTQSLLASENGALARQLEADRRAQLSAAGRLAQLRIHYNGPVRATALTAVRTALAQIGDPYRWGAAGPDAFDCSGLTMYAWAHAGVGLPHSSRAQYASLPHVGLDQLAPGDLVFSGSPIHHVAIYEGNGVVVHAPHSGQTVREASVWSLHPVGAARP